MMSITHVSEPATIVARRRTDILERMFCNRFAFIFSLILFKLILDVSYILFVHPVYAYAGFTLHPTILKGGESWLLLLGIGYVSSYRLERVSDFLALLMVVFLITPLLSLYALADKPRITVYSVLLCYLTILIFRRGRRIKFPSIRQGHWIALGLSVIALGLTLGWMFARGAFSYLNINITKVYEFRDEVELTLGGGVLGYLSFWAFKVFNLFLIAYSLYRRHFSLVMLFLLVQLLLYSILAHKAILFYPLLVLFAYYYFSRSKALAVLPMAVTLACIAALMISLSTDLVIVAGLLVRRAFFTVANNVFEYYDVFSARGYVFWSDRLLSFFLDYPYPESPSRMMGIWRGDSGNVNNSFVATGYMHAGIFGVAIYGVVVGLLFRITDSLARPPMPLWFCTGVVVVPFWSLLISTDLFTALLTHGVAASLFLLWLSRNTRLLRLGG